MQVLLFEARLEGLNPSRIRSIRQHTPAFASMPQHAPAYASMRSMLKRSGIALTRHSFLTAHTDSLADAEVQVRMLPYAAVCCRMLADADGCWRMLADADGC
jgi:hypothetical protein